jgi:SAM-dependent methyltransferase
LARGCLDDRDHLLEVQYRDSSRLADRRGLHTKYSTSDLGWYDFVLERAALFPGARVLEMGCGPGWLWEQATHQVPDGVHLVLTDLFPGMVEDATTRCRATARFATVNGLVADAQELPFEDESFDFVFANHMLYHVPRPERAVTEARRLLTTRGSFVAATNGSSHLLEIRQLQKEIFGATNEKTNAKRFGADTGVAVLRRHFGEVSWLQFEDELHCTDPADIAAYLGSTPPCDTASAEQLAALHRVIEREFDRGNGVMRVTKDVGVFVCQPGRERPV